MPSERETPGQDEPHGVVAAGRFQFRAGQSSRGAAECGGQHLQRPHAALDCATLVAEILALDSTVGPDIDLLKATGYTNMCPAFLWAIRGMVPFRGVLRVR